MLAKDVLKSARYTLSDTAANRWTDERLLSLLNDGLKEIAKTTTLFYSTMFLGISDLIVDYDLSDRVIKYHRFEYLNEPIDMKTMEEMDKINTKWQSDTGDTPLCVVIGKQNQGQFKLYPIISNLENSYITFTQTYGIITYITYSDIEYLIVDTFGDLGSLEDTGYLKIYYTRKHPILTDINDTIELDDLTQEPLAHYVAGRALRDNMDVQNRTFGNEELGLFTKMLEDYSIEKAKNFSAKIYETEYRPS